MVALHGETCTNVTKVLSEIAKQCVLAFRLRSGRGFRDPCMHKMAFRLGDDGPTQMTRSGTVSRDGIS